MRVRLSSLVTAIIVASLVSTDAIARDPWADSALNVDRFVLPAVGVISPDSTDLIPWPTYYGVHQTNAVNAAFDCSGTIGMPVLGRNNPYPFWPSSSFESPPGSGHQYLFAGTIWIGGIVGVDTVVSTGFSNWQYHQEMYPTGYSSTLQQGTVTPFGYPTATSYRAESDDTLHSGINYSADRFGNPYRPLGVTVVYRTHSFEGDRAEECIIYDALITNVGSQIIREGYCGIYLDADVYSTHGDLLGYTDDLAGSIRNRGIAYIVDNDGDPMQGTYSATRSPTKVIAFKYLNSSFVARDTNFNWWVPSNNPASDFGPRQKAFPRDFGAFGIGSPYGDGNEYYVMSTPEWDYDQVMTGTIQPDDPQWAYPNPATTSEAHRGGDTRFLMSIGPFDLKPDSTVRVQFAVFTADSVHADPFILDFVDIAPELYAPTLNLPNVVSNAAAADSLGDLMIDPALPPTGLHTIASTDSSATVGWDPWVFADIDSCDIFLSIIPDTAFRHAGLIPPWYQPTSLQLREQVTGTAASGLLTDLSPGVAYACNVAFRTGSQVGAPSAPALFRTPDARYAIQMQDSLLYVTPGDNSVVHWSGADAERIDHFNIYRFADTAEAGRRYTPFYSRQRLDIEPVDSVDIDSSRYYYYALPVYAQVPRDMRQFEDPAWTNGNVYAVAAVDSSGTEFPLSGLAIAYLVPSRTKDICVLTNSGGKINFVYGSTLKSFYSSVLSGYQYDIFSYLDTVSAGCGMYLDQCIDWRDFMRYRTLIIDDGLKDALFSSQFEERTSGYRRYLQSGGTIVYFGSFSQVGGNRLNATTNPAWFSLSHPVAADNFGVDSVFYTGLAYYNTHTTAPYVDSLFGFVRAESVIGGAPDLQLEVTFSPFTTDLATYWPVGTAPSVSAFGVNGRGEISHLYRSATPETSVNEGQPVGIVTQLAQGQTFLFGFHLWYMQEADARQLIDWIMERVPTDAPEQQESALPETFALAQNYPNPFNPNTIIAYSVPAKSHVRLEVFNILGQSVRTLVDESKGAGDYEVTWNGRDSRGQSVSTGVYLYRLRVGEAVLTKKMLLLK